MTKYFKNVKSLEDLKNQFKILARKNHPDAGGDAENMKAINCEYDALFPIWKDHHNTAEPQNQTTETADSTRSQFYTECGWEGKNHNWNRSLKEVAQIVRAYVKEKYPTYKFSVRTEYASMCQELHVELKESPVEIYKPGEELIAEYVRVTAEHGDFYKVMNEVTKAVITDVDSFVKSYNYEDCDGMIDYFHVDFYYFGCCRNNGQDVKIVPKTARIENRGTVPAKAKKTAEPAPVKKQEITEKLKYTYKITKGEDTRDGSELWLVRIAETLDREAYKSEAATMKERGGYYSKFRKAFIFRFDPTELLTGKKAA